MIAKEYTKYINAYFKNLCDNGVFFINKESSEPLKLNFGDRRLYTVEIWAVNGATKEKVFTIKDSVLYEDGKMKEVCKDALIERLWVLTLKNLQEINKYGIK